MVEGLARRPAKLSERFIGYFILSNYDIEDLFLYSWLGQNTFSLLQTIQTISDSHPASYSVTMGTGSFPGVKRPERGADHPPHLSAEVMKG